MSEASKGMYGYRWQRAREEWLRAHPLCIMHRKLGRIVKGTVVDHKVPHRGDPTLFWDQANWQTLCASCHNAHKQSQEATGRERGCSTDGMPLDPAHHWNTG